MHPVFFEFPESIPILGGAKIYAYGVMLGLGFISGWYLGLHFANRERFDYKVTVTTYVLAIVFALIGARVAHLITNPSTWRFTGFFPALFTSKCEGLVAYGGFIGALAAVWVYVKYMKKQDVWSLVDCTTPSMALGLGFTRIGCFLAGCCHGQPTDLPWGVVFPPGSQAAGTFPGAHGSVPVHPTQLYESAVGFLLVPIALLALKRRKFTGQAFLIVMPLYAIARFLLEFIRGDADRGGFGNHADPTLSTSQFIGLLLIPLAIGLYLYRRKVGPAPPAWLSKEEVAQRLLEQGVLKKKEAKGGKEKPAEQKAPRDEPATKQAPSSGNKKKKKKKKKKR